MEKFVEKYNLLKRHEEEEESLNGLTVGEIEAVIKKSQHTKTLDETVSQENFTKHLRKT